MNVSDRYSETKYHILLGIYVGAWGIVPGLTPKLIPLNLDWTGIGILAFSFGAFMHAITFPCTDTVAEVWGSARARLMVYLGSSMYGVAILFYMVGTRLPAAPGWELNDAYVAIFSLAERMIIASVCATVVAQLLDIYVFEKIKRATGEKWLWLRNNGSTAISQFVDTAIFYSIAFYGVIPNDQLPLLVFGTYLVKLVITVVDTPIVYLLVRWITDEWSSKGDLKR
ncbi:MAG: queuosine precursor transporter [Pseudomonadales bacterium]|nr:queuosine precursor transporter [Pseudomonadales bacterium]MBO6564711.1 queuosine precursor transporter [Pseudomonadales bacterium]MBO6595510.1 queuosine precursor transporter [Pseudomonadales bacterium]MBO6657082.1 queuosine precursor transporter [Pseudomonadales bacterium]MBO6702010.1 queuosine precursor transporter [Pseudomonadales bacterium]